MTINLHESTQQCSFYRAPWDVISGPNHKILGYTPKRVSFCIRRKHQGTKHNTTNMAAAKSQQVYRNEKTLKSKKKKTQKKCQPNLTKSKRKRESRKTKLSYGDLFFLLEAAAIGCRISGDQACNRSFLSSLAPASHQSAASLITALLKSSPSHPFKSTIICPIGK